jgi:hypothetical protein
MEDKVILKIFLDFILSLFPFDLFMQVIFYSTRKQINRPLSVKYHPMKLV